MEGILRGDILCATEITPLLVSISEMMNIRVQFPRSKRGWAGKAKEKKDQMKRKRKLTPSEENRLFRAAKEHKNDMKHTNHEEIAAERLVNLQLAVDAFCEEHEHGDALWKRQPFIAELFSLRTKENEKKSET